MGLRRSVTELSRSGGLDLAVIVAVGAVRVVQVAGDEVIDMIAVRYGLVAAAGTMLMLGWMAATAVRRRAGSRIGAANR